MMYSYPNWFKELVLNLFKDDEEIKKLLTLGDENIGFKLLELSSKEIPSSKIIEAYESNNIKALYLEAKKIAEAVKALKEWKTIVWHQGGEEAVLRIELKLKP